jgi:hypothetical protein
MISDSFRFVAAPDEDAEFFAFGWFVVLFG